MTRLEDSAWTLEDQAAFDKWRENQSADNFDMLFASIKKTVGNEYLAELWRIPFLFCSEQLDKMRNEFGAEVTSDIYADVAILCAHKSRKWSEELFKELQDVANILAEAKQLKE